MRIIITLMLVVIALGAAAQRTSRQGLRPERGAEADAAAVADVPLFVAVSPDSVAVSLAGYDKPQRSARESFHAVNADTLWIGALALTFTYYDTSGQMLHRVRRRVAADLPAGETRLLTVPSWDRQRAFYYIHSAPQRTAGTPYDVTIDIDTVFVANRRKGL